MQVLFCFIRPILSYLFDFLSNYITHGRLLFCGFADLEFCLEKSRNSDLKGLSRYHLFALFLHRSKKETIGKAWISLCLVIRETRFPSWRAAEATPSQFLELSYQVSITLSSNWWILVTKRGLSSLTFSFKFQIERFHNTPSLKSL